MRLVNVRNKRILESLRAGDLRMSLLSGKLGVSSLFVPLDETAVGLGAGAALSLTVYSDRCLNLGK